MSDMPWELYIDASPGERRAATVDPDGRLDRLRVERDGRRTLAETILRARVTSVDKQTGAAFLDCGKVGAAMLPKGGKLTEGQAVTVQITREAHGRKVPVCGRAWTLTERYLSWTLGRKGIGWSRALGQGKARATLEGRISEALKDATPEIEEGLHVRAQAVGATMDALARDLKALAERREAVLSAEEGAKPGDVIEARADFGELAMRDAPAEARVATDDRALFGMLKRRSDERWPDLTRGLVFHDPAKRALFDEAGISDAIDDALSREVAIPGGGRLTIDETEAMVVIDVDSGGSSDGGGLKEEAVFRLNKRAGDEAARQIRLRNLSGLIVIDFVTLRGKGRMKALIESLRARVKADPVKTDVLGSTAAGLVEITRQRFGPSLSDVMLAPRNVGPALAPDAQAAAILRAAVTLKGAGKPVAYASEAVEKALAGPMSDAKAECDRRLGTPLEVRRGPDTFPPRVEMERSR